MTRSMKVLIGAVLVLVVALAALVVRTAELSDRIDQLSQNLSYAQNALQDQIGDIYNNVDQQLTEQASLMTTADCTLGDLDPATHTVPATVTVVPKVIADDTVLTLTVEDQTAELTREGNAFTGQLPVPIFLTYEDPVLLTIRSGSQTQTQELTDLPVYFLWYDYLPQMSGVSLDGTTSLEGEDLLLDGTLYISLPMKQETIRWQSVAVVAEIGDREVLRTDLTEEVLDTIYQEGDYLEPYIEAVPAKAGDNVCFYLEAVDDLGYLHRTLVYGAWADQGGYYEHYGNERIYDPDGTLLFDPMY